MSKQIRKIRGPYKHSQNNNSGLANRAYYQIIYEDGSKSTILRSRYMIEEFLGRKLHRYEHVHHIDNDVTNDSLENFKVITDKEHAVLTKKGKPSIFKGIEKGWTHGTVYGWMKKKCECSLCTEAKQIFMRARNERRRKK